MNEYSLSKLLKDLIAMQSNSIAIVDALSKTATTNNETVTVNLQRGGTATTVTFPSFGKIQNQLTILDKNIKNLSGLVDDSGSNTAVIQTLDGKTRKILTSSAKREAETISQLNKPNTFNKKENWFFESFLNPLLYITFDLTGKLKDYTREVEVSRFILNIDTQSKLNTYNTSLEGKDDIKYSEFIQLLADNSINYNLDKSIVPTSVKSIKHKGDFKVLSIIDTIYTLGEFEVIFGMSDTSFKVLDIKLDKLIYSENGIPNKTLKRGDHLLFENTKYEIVEVIESEVVVRLKLVEGFDSIAVGSTISFYSNKNSNLLVDINIGFNERCVVFIKGVDPDSSILASDFSPGVGFYTNDLTIREGNSTIKLDKYYQDKVLDFGTFLYSSVKEKTIPALLGVKPDAPILTSSNFKVEQINNHLDAEYYNSILNRQNEKPILQSTIQELDKSISNLRLKLNSNVYSSEQARSIDQNELTTLLTKRDTAAQSLETIINTIDSDISRVSIDKISPKYRVRGFYPFPDPKKSNRTKDQHVIQFIVQYRYIGKNGSPNSPSTLEYIGLDGKSKNGVYSSWIEFKTNVRNKILNPIDGQFYWSSDSTDDSNIVNINQIDIPINTGEGVEFRVKSISEAGWPTAAIMSDWSDIIKIDFPAELETNLNKDIVSLADQNKLDKLKNQLFKDFQSMNLDKLSNLTFLQNGNFYATDTKNIASGFTTNEKNIINLFDKLLEMDNQIKELKAKIENTRGNLAVSIIDEYGNEYKIEKNKTLRIDAGSYKDEVESLIIKKGAIITKTYILKLSNSVASDLELYSKYWGPGNVLVNNGLIEADYDLNRKYHLAPIGLSNINSNSSSHVAFPLPKQSAQVRGQYIYNRAIRFEGQSLYKDWKSMDIAPDWSISDAEITAISGSTGGTSSDNKFIWNFTWNLDKTINAIDITDSTKYNSILIHEDHPSIQKIIQDTGPGLSKATELALSSNNIINSKCSNFDLNTWNTLEDKYYWQQSAFNLDIDSNSSKICFLPEDRYLIGASSVGSYLFISPSLHDDIRVNGTFFNSDKILKFGSSNSISIPIIFQYRMTDYFGKGDTGIGNIAGKLNNTNTNLAYSKCLGFDIYTNKLEKDIFSFDLDITARYESISGTNTNIPATQITNSLGDLIDALKQSN